MAIVNGGGFDIVLKETVNKYQAINAIKNNINTGVKLYIGTEYSDGMYVLFTPIKRKVSKWNKNV